MSGFQIGILIWLSILTLGVLVLAKVVYILATDRLEQDKKAKEMREALDLSDPRSNPFLKAGLEVIKKKKKEARQDG